MLRPAKFEYSVHSGSLAQASEQRLSRGVSSPFGEVAVDSIRPSLFRSQLVAVAAEGRNDAALFGHVAGAELRRDLRRRFEPSAD